VNVARPSQILGGGAGGGKIPETFLYHKIKLFESKKFHVGIPTKYLFRGRFSLYPSQLVCKVMLFVRGLNLFLKKNQEISKEFSPLLENQNSFLRIESDKNVFDV
jgi:hypothetical protein